MDIYDIRRHNVEALVRAAGGPTGFGRRIGREQAQVSQWISPTRPKPIGGRLARDIEARLGREHGWLDSPNTDAGAFHAAAPQAPPGNESKELRPDPTTLRHALVITERVLEKTRVTVKPEVRADIVLAMYDLIHEGQGLQLAERTVTRMLSVLRGATVPD